MQPNNNPFEHGNPVPPERYVQRRVAQATVVSRVVNYGQSSAITGEPRMGKTSLLLYLAAPEMRAQLYGEWAERLIFSPLMDAHKLSAFGIAQFWTRALRSVYAHFGVVSSALNDEADSLEHLQAALSTARQALGALERQAAGYTVLTIPAPLQIELEAKHKDVIALTARWQAATRPSNAPSSSIAACLAALSAQPGDPFALEDLFAALKAENWRFVLLIDEYDCFQSRLHTHDFYGGLRSVATLSQGALCVIIAGRMSLETFHQRTVAMNQGSPYFNYMAEIGLSVFAPDESAGLLARAGDRFTSEDCQRLLTLTGGHPHRLQVAAAALWDAYENAARWQHVEAALKIGDQGLGACLIP
ncbi:MAG TPA: hypothetical protein PKH77_13990, partial [Anaerolineae bacterium]|nr:hypothetical protein [Anaerolineae bacterium]